MCSATQNKPRERRRDITKPEAYVMKLIYLFFSSSSMLNFSLAFLRSIDPRLELEDLRIGDKEELLLLCLLWFLGVGERLLWRLGGERLLRCLGEIERLFRLYKNIKFIEQHTKTKMLKKLDAIIHISIKSVHHLVQ
jgi:hypothetical protein